MKMKKICVLFAAIILAAGMWAYAAEWEVISQNAPAEISSEQMDGEGTDFREPDWDFYYPDYEYNGFIWGVVEVDGVQVDDINDMIGAFVGDECRGIAQQSDNSVQDYAVPFGHVAFMPMVYSNVTSGETLTFKYYDASEDLIWDVSNTLGFTADMVVGNGMEPFIFAVSTTAPAEPHFTPVWEGLADTPLYPHTISVLSATIGGVELVAGDEIAVFDVDGTGNEICVGAMVVSEAAPYAVIASWDHYATPEMDGYIIDHPVIFRIWDASAEAELTEITPTLIPPWTGTYVFNGNTQVILEAAAENIPPVADAGEDQIVIEGDLVQLDGSGSYDPDGETEREPDWSINPPDYEYNGSIWGIVILDGVEVIETTGILGCFVENECRGIATFENGSVLDYTVPFGHIIFLPMVYSNVTGGETITFKYWDANTDMIYDVEETIEWVADMVVGDGFNPFEFTVNTMPTSDLEFLWTAPDGIELSDVNSMMPYFIAPEVDEETMFTFSLIVSDGEAWSEPDEVVITVLNSNLAPVIDLPDFFMFNEDEFLEIDFIAEGYIWDPDDDTLILTHSGNEDIILEITGGVVLFSAPANWFGEEVITFTVDDNETRLTASDDVLVIVNPVNDPPQFDYTETEIVFNEDESAVVDFEEYLFDVDGDELSMYVVGAEVIITEIDGFVITFSAPQDWNGTESIVIGVTDNQDRAVAEINVDIVVLPVNDAPVIDLPPVVEMDEDTTLEFDISPYVNDVDGDELVISDITVYDAGEWEISYSGLVAFIAPGENYYTTCDVQITITDNVTRATAEDVFQLIVHPVNDVPEINLPEMFVFDEDESLEVDFAEYVFDVDGDELVLTVSETENIIVEIAGLMVTFSAPENWFGEELLTFTVDDQVGRAIATADVIITVNSVNDEPVAVPGGPYLAQGDAEGFADIELDGSLSYDIDGEIVAWEWSWLDGYGEGEILIATFEVGETEVTLTVTDNEEGVGTAITTVTITEYGNIPPVAEADYFEGLEDETISGNVLVNDMDPDEFPEALTAEIVTEPGFGELEFFANGDFVYTPDADWYGEDIFTYHAFDGIAYSAEAEVILNVIAVNDPPVADAGVNQTVNEGDLVVLDGSLSYDIDNDAISYLWEAPAAVFLNDADSATPSFIAPSVNEDTSYEITLTVSDGEYSDSDIVVITVLNAEIPDVEAEITITSGEGEPGDPINIEVQTTYIDPAWNVFSYEFFLSYNDLELSLDGWSLENTIVDPNGILEVEFLRGVVNFKFTSQISSGGREFIPIEGEGSLINLEFTSLTGGQAQFDIYGFTFNTEEIEVTLPGVINNSAPYVAVPIPEQTVLEDFEPFTIDLNDYITDDDGDELIYEMFAGEGIIVELYDSVLVFSSIENFFGTVMVTVTAWDGYSDLSTVTTEFDVVVVSVNDIPVIDLPEFFTFREFTTLEVDFNEYVYDADGDVLELTYSGNENVLIDVSGLVVTFSAAANWFGQEVITFTVDDGMGRAVASDDVTVIVSSSDAPDWAVIPGTQYSMQLYSQVRYLGQYFTNSNSANIVAAFGPGGDNDCRAIAFWNEYNQYELWYMTIVSNAEPEDNEIITFKIYDADNDTILTCRESMTFADNTIIGSYDDTFLLTIPFVIDDVYGAYEDSLLTILPASGVLINDEIPLDYLDEFWAVLNPDVSVSHGELDFNEDGSFTYMPDENYFGSDFFEYYATDGVYITNYASVEIQVQPVNDPPVIELPLEGFTFPEDTVYQQDFAPYIYDVDNELSELTLTYSGNNNIAVGVNGLIVTFTPDADWHGTEIINFTINDNTARAIASDTISVTVTPVNDPPIVENPIADFEFFEDTIDNHINLDYVFFDIDGDDLQYGVLDNVNLNVVIDEFANVTISSYQENWNGVETIIFSAFDQEYTVYDTVTVTVIPVNDSPVVLVPLPDLELEENFAAVQIDLDLHFFDVDGDILEYSSQFNYDHVLITIENNIMTISSVPYWNGTTEVSVAASDDQYSVNDAFQIVVTPVNHPPVVLVPLPDTQMAEDADPVLRDLNYYFADYDNDHLDYTVDFVATEMNAWIIDDFLYFQPLPDWFGYSSITVTASDSYEEVSDTFDVTVIPVNDPPYVYNEIPDFVLEEGFPAFNLDLFDYFDDIDSDSLLFSASLTVQNSVVISITDNIMSISSLPQWNGSVDVTVTAQDDFDRLTASDTFNITVIPVNDPPYLISEIDDQDVNEDFEPFDIDLSLFFADPEDDPLTYSADFNDSQIGIVIIENIMTISSVFNWFGTSQVTVYASDGVMGNEPAFSQFSVIVQPVNDPPFVEVPIDDFNVLEDFDTFTINLDDHFTDYDDVLTYSVQYDADMISASIVTSILAISSLDNVNGDTQVTVVADDGNRITVADSFWIFIAPVNDPPVIILPDSFQFYSGGSLQENFAQYVTDVDSDVLTLSASGNVNVLIDIDGLMVTFTNTEGWNGTEQVTFSVSDEDHTAYDDVDIIVLPEAEGLTIDLPPSFTFNEDESLISNFANFISNPDDFDLLLEADGNIDIIIDIDELMVTFSAPPDWNGSEIITFTVSNVNGPEFSTDFAEVIVIPINDPPVVIVPIPDQYILEDSGVHQIDLDTHFYDVDGDVLQYSANFNNQEISVDIIYLNLYFEPATDWFGTTTIIVTAQDDYNRYTVSDTFDVIVEPVNDPPYIVTYFNDITKAEDFATFTIDFTGYFADVDDDVLYYEVDFDPAHISVVLTGTVLEISSIQDWFGITSIAVTASDLEDSVTDQFNLIVNPVNDPPVVILPLPDLYLLEDFDAQFIDLDDHFYDPDNDLTYYAYANSNEIQAEIVQNILQLNSVLNWYGTTSIEVVANDLENRAIAVDTFLVFVEPVNDPPVILVPLEDITINEDTVSAPVNLNAHFYDVDGDALVYSAEVSDPNGIVIIEENLMTVTAVEDWWGSFEAYITADDLMGRAAVTDTILVTVLPVNDPPHIVSPLPDLEFDEDFEPYYYDLSQNFDDVDGDQLYYYAQYNSEHITLTINGSMMQINSIQNWNGSTTVIISASDTINRASISDEFMIIVNPVNDPPHVIAPIPNQNRLEDFVTFSLNLDLYFGDIDGDELFYTAIASEALVELEVLDNLLFISSLPDLYGSVEITVTADDGYNRLTVSDTFILTIQPVNDPPVLTLPNQFTYDEDTYLIVDFDDMGYVYDVDNDIEDLSLASFGEEHVIISITGMIVTFSADVNWFGSEIIVFSLSDDLRRFTVYDTVTVVVNPVNDPPFFEFAIPDQQIYEGGEFDPINLNYYVTDVDDPDDVLVWEYSGNTDLLVDIDPVTHIAIVSVPDDDWNGNENITFTVTDPQQESASTTVNFEVLPVNDAPVVILPLPDLFLEINFPPFSIDLSPHFDDVDGDPLTYYVDYNNEEISAGIQGNMLNISSIVNWYGVSEVIVTADDNINRATVSDTFMINITYTITQTMDLGIMWNWISFYVQPVDYSLEYVFGPLGDNVNTVKYQTQSADYYPEYDDWAGDLEEIHDGGGYLVNVTDPVPGFSLTGNRIMSDTPIDLIAQWNWIAYYPPSPDSLTSALYSILDNVHIVKNQTQSAEYFPEVGNGVWFGDLQLMAPGIGYKVLMYNPDELVYPLYPVVTRENNHALALPDNSPEEWTIMPGTSDNMILMLSANYNGNHFEWAEGRALGVFDENDVCRAHGIWQDSQYLEQGFWYFTIVGNNSGTPLYFKLIDEYGNESASLDLITFQPDTKTGNPFDPYQIAFYSVDEDDNQIVPVNALSQNYPNPFNPETAVRFSLAQDDNVELTVYNLRGEKIKVLLREPREAGSYSVIWNGTDDRGNKVASGVYFYSIKTSQYSATRKMVMIK